MVHREDAPCPHIISNHKKDCTMKKTLTILVMFLTSVALAGHAQESKDSLYIIGTVADGFTKAAVPDAFVTLMRQDSTVVDTMHVHDSHTWVSGVGRGNATSRYYFQVSREPQDYIIKVEHPNYEIAFTNYTQKKVSRRLQYTYIPTAYLKKAAKAHHHVGNFFVRYKPNIRYQKGNLTLRLKGELNYRNIHRNIEAVNQPTDVWDFSYGIDGSYKLPWNFTVDTDLTMHSHRGYADAEMNDNRLYWDASLTKSLAQGRWVLKLRGYDLLGQVSSLRYSINAQGRTETWTNSMRRYAMLTVSYRFTKTPKKKQ